MNRRKFLKTSLAATAAFTIVPRHVLGGKGFTPPSDLLTKAVIGVGGMGMWHVLHTPGKLLAVCDVDSQHLQNALDCAGNGVQGYKDFREVLLRDDIDIIHIATPPHWHALISIAAANAGKDIWCEKPMTRTIGEGLKVMEAVRRNGVIFRLNTWFRFDGEFYDFGTTVKPIKKLVQSGLLGWPLKVTVSEATGFMWKFFWVGRTHLPAQWIPEHLDYDFWLGPAPYKPYHPHRVHKTFRGYWDYDGGGLGDMGQHFLDPVQYILDKDETSPVEIEADAPQSHPDAVLTWRTIRLRYADGCEIVLDGRELDQEARAEERNSTTLVERSRNERKAKAPGLFKDAGIALRQSENEYENEIPFIEGPNGSLFKGFRSDIPNLKEKLAELPDPQPQITDFHYAVRTRQKFALNEQNAHRSCTLVNLAKIAVRLGRTLYFDPDQQVFINDESANRLINEPMRSPWTIDM